MYVTVEDMRRYLNLPFCDDDYLLAQFIEAAEDVITAQQIKDTLDAFDKYKECEYQYDFDGEIQFLNQFFDLIKEKIRRWWN